MNKYICIGVIANVLYLMSCGFVINDDPIDASLMSIYYDPKYRTPYRMSSIENSLTNMSYSIDQSSVTKSGADGLRRIAFRSNGCTCQELTCGCCAGLNLQQFNFNREACTNFTYDPDEFAINLNVLMDGNSVYSNAYSARNPPPLCIPVPIPYLPVSVEACAKLFDIYTPGQNLHMCFDFETRIQRATVLVLHFDCMRMGNNGVALVKPGDIEKPPTTATESQIDSDIYDKVTEIKYKIL